MDAAAVPAAMAHPTSWSSAVSFAGGLLEYKRRKNARPASPMRPPLSQARGTTPPLYRLLFASSAAAVARPSLAARWRSLAGSSESRPHLASMRAEPPVQKVAKLDHVSDPAALARSGAVVIQDFGQAVALAPSGRVESLSPGVHFGPHFLARAASLRRGGASELQVITDFDQTLTTYTGSDGKEGDQCHDIMLLRLPAEEEALRSGLTEALAPLREWMDMPEEQRMVVCNGDMAARRERTRWFNHTFLKIAVQFQYSELAASCVQRSNVRLRPGLAQTFSWLEATSVPLLIVSAGLTQVIQFILETSGARLPAGAEILANDLREEVARVTRLTKAAALSQLPEYRRRAAGRRRVLVLGDKPSDCKVVEGLEDGCDVLKVGFMRASPLPSEIDEYLNHFDVALTDDAPMDFVNTFLQSISDCSEAGKTSPANSAFLERLALEEMTVSALRELCAARNLPLSGLAQKQDFVDLLLGEGAWRGRVWKFDSQWVSRLPEEPAVEANAG